MDPHRTKLKKKHQSQTRTKGEEQHPQANNKDPKRATYTSQGSLFCLFCFSHWDLPIHGTLYCTIGTVGKPSTSPGAKRQFCNVQTFGVRNIEYWTIFLLKIQQNHTCICSSLGFKGYCRFERTSKLGHNKLAKLNPNNLYPVPIGLDLSYQCLEPG